MEHENDETLKQQLEPLRIKLELLQNKSNDLTSKIHNLRKIKGGK